MLKTDKFIADTYCIYYTLRQVILTILRDICMYIHTHFSNFTEVYMKL